MFVVAFVFEGGLGWIGLADADHYDHYRSLRSSSHQPLPLIINNLWYSKQSTQCMQLTTRKHKQTHAKHQGNGKTVTDSCLTQTYDITVMTVTKFSRYKKLLHNGLLMQCQAASATYVKTCNIVHKEKKGGRGRVL
jgi:hypothetical protein